MVKNCNMSYICKMLKKYLFCFMVLVMAAAVMPSCRSKYQKVLKSDNYEQKLVAANAYYDKKDFFRAQTIYDELRGVYLGSEKQEEINYKYADCTYRLKDFYSARYYFKYYLDNFPRGIYAEEATFKGALCYCKDSPIHSLDQTNTTRAIETLQIFVNTYPESNRIDTCNTLIDKLRDKLEQKAYENAKLFYKTEQYKSAITSLNNAIDDFPDCEYVEEMNFLRVSAAYEFAKNSVATKQEERYRTVIELHQAFADTYPNSGYVKQSEKVYDDALRFLEKNIKTTTLK